MPLWLYLIIKIKQDLKYNIYNVLGRFLLSCLDLP